MKKIISALVLTVLLGTMAVPVLAQITDMPETCDPSAASGKINECDGTALCNPEASSGDDNYQENCGFCCLMATIYRVTDWMFMILMLVVVLMIIWGGFQYVTAGGDPEKAGKGKQILTFAIIGLAIALLAKIIPSVVQYVIGVN